MLSDFRQRSARPFIDAVLENHQLFHLCAILSVLWDRCWTVREAPDIAAAGIRVPKVVGGFRVRSEDVPFRRQPETVTLPTWAGDAWQTLHADPIVMRAVTAHYIGLRYVAEDPSIALLAFVAALETIGGKLTSEGSAKRLKAALARTLGTRQRRELRNVYGYRSGTAHALKLHGSEAFFGAEQGGFFMASPAFVFENAVLPTLQHASRKLLLKALRRRPL